MSCDPQLNWLIFKNQAYINLPKLVLALQESILGKNVHLFQGCFQSSKIM